MNVLQLSTLFRILKSLLHVDLHTCNLLTLSQGISKQAATGRTKDDTVFPLTVKFTDVSQNLSVGDLYSPSSTMDNPLDQLQKQVSLCVPHVHVYCSILHV